MDKDMAEILEMCVRRRLVHLHGSHEVTIERVQIVGAEGPSVSIDVEYSLGDGTYSESYTTALRASVDFISQVGVNEESEEV